MAELVIPIPPLSRPAVAAWVAEFNRRETLWATPPRLEAGKLRVGTLAFPFLLGYADRTQLNELDLQRVVQSGTRQLEDLLQRLDLPHHTMVQHALENLKRIGLGEFTDA